MNTLKIVIKAQYFDLIASGEKTIEYRDVTPFWTSRLFDENGKRKLYERIEFINGYNINARRMVTGFEGFTTGNNHPDQKNHPRTFHSYIDQYFRGYFFQDRAYHRHSTPASPGFFCLRLHPLD
ncbi:ASCH domain-containing protein [Flavihumibacter stibioxidans]|uniref:ASCH domain-containing protein n=1 Tax=Flavihumibacter stibioxidans TaxID=1834163 RepID=A0ABR7M8C7_9BACT|nr:ASCH domain-containing protein [Flavihumibacter stibioxidans]MBC6491284.1 hypothetical protein [Flavihumibacter stibioxidans]